MLRLTEEPRPKRAPADMTDLPCRSLGLVVGWSTLTKLGRAVAEHGRGVVEIWESLSAESQEGILTLRMREPIRSAAGPWATLPRQGLARVEDGYRLTPLGRAVAEYGRTMT